MLETLPKITIKRTFRLYLTVILGSVFNLKSFFLKKKNVFDKIQKINLKI